MQLQSLGWLLFSLMNLGRCDYMVCGRNRMLIFNINYDKSSFFVSKTLLIQIVILQ